MTKEIDLDGIHIPCGTLPCTCGHEVRLETREPVEDRPDGYEAARGILETAAEYVAGPRSSYYGHPLDNHGRTATLQEAYLVARGWTPPPDSELTEEDVCWMNVLQKIARDMNVPSDDGVIDVAGYAANVAEVRAERVRRGA